MVSIVTIHPSNSSISNSLGIAVISLLFSSHANCPSSKPHSEDSLRRELAWLESTDPQNRDYYRQDQAEDMDPPARLRRRLGQAEGDGASSVDNAKALLKRLIDGEDRRRSLSDEKLCRLMAKEGCAISRRTAAKYLDELGIPSTVGRRRKE